MNKRAFILFGLVLAVAIAAFAHGDKKHILGTVEKLSGDLVVVKTSDGKSVEVKLAPSTVYVSRAGNQDKPAKLSDLAVGDRVVIHATANGESLTADEVKFSHRAANHSAGAATKPKQ